MSQIDTHSVVSQGSMMEKMIVKFNVHKKMKEMLETDLNDKITKKAKYGINTYFFGDNRQGKCGTGNDDPFVIEPMC
jgi:hypothetical protein